MTLAETEKPKPKRYSAVPLVWLTAALAFGIVSANAFPFLANPFHSTLAIVPILLAIGAIFLFRKYSFAAVLILFVFFWLGAILFHVEISGMSEDRIARIYDSGRVASGDPVEIEGSVIGATESAMDGVFVNISVRSLSNRGNDMTASGRVRMFLPLTNPNAVHDLEALRLRHGALVSIVGVLNREDGFLNPGVTPRAEILHRQGIDATGTIKSPLLIEVIERESRFSPMAMFFDFRNSAIDKFAEMFSPRTAGLLIATILGDKYFLDRETADTFRAGGTFHILVISGLHMTFIGGLILLIVRRFTRNRWLHFVLTAAAVWMYTLSVGAEPPAVRASLMITIVLLGQALYRNANLLNSLAATALILLIWKPSDLFNPSFQLTIVSVFAIVGIAVPLIGKLRSIGEWTPTTREPFPPNAPQWLVRICETLYWNDKAWEIESARHTWSARLAKKPLFTVSWVRRSLTWAVDGIFVSAIVQLCMLPLLVYYFHRMPVAALFLNLWVGAMMAVMSLTASVAVVISQVASLLAWPLVQFTEIVSGVMTTLSGLVAGPGGRRIPIYSGDGEWIYLVYFIPVIVIAVLVLRWKPFDIKRSKAVVTRFVAAASALAIILIGCMIFFHPYSEPVADGKLNIDFLDVGQGDSALITFPNGETMLVDGGGRINYSDDDDDFEPDRARIGEMVVSEFLWERGYSRVDHIMASHADADHIQGLVDVASNFEIGKAYFASLQGESKDYLELSAVLDRRGVRRELLQAGDAFEIAGVRIDVLYPSPSEAGLTENDRSLVVVLSYGEKRILLTGDIEREGEARLVNSGKLASFSVVKAPHHGSRTSSTQTFVNAVNARTVIIPVGRRSIFGHPHLEVVGRWKLSGAETMTTGSKGTITVSTDGRTLEISQFKP
jgi:competence protein ComEC